MFDGLYRWQKSVQLAAQGRSTTSPRADIGIRGTSAGAEAFQECIAALEQQQQQSAALLHQGTSANAWPANNVVANQRETRAEQPAYCQGGEKGSVVIVEEAVLVPHGEAVKTCADGPGQSSEECEAKKTKQWRAHTLKDLPSLKSASWAESHDFLLPGVVSEPESESSDGPASSTEYGPEKEDELEGRLMSPTPEEHLQKQSRVDLSGSRDSNASANTAATITRAGSSMTCHQCNCEGQETFLDRSDMKKYCTQCWLTFYGQSPPNSELLVPVGVVQYWLDGTLAENWSKQQMPGWPPKSAQSTHASFHSAEENVWSSLRLRVRRDVVGGHAREQRFGNNLSSGEIVAGRYCVQQLLGEGHFTKAFLSKDLTTGNHVCLKRHRCLSMEALMDLLAISKRLEAVDACNHFFPRLLDSFFDGVGFTVESLVEGRNCLVLAQAEPDFFSCMEHLRAVSRGALAGLSFLEAAGIVHNDLKPDNIIWRDGTGTMRDPDGSSPDLGGTAVQIVDFGCARLDCREEPAGWNWSLAEGGAGHLGKWSPEMVLRLPITHSGDIWGLAISLCELHCGRFVWSNESDTAEVVLAQSLGLCDFRDGLPWSLLQRSPLDVRQLYTPAPRHLPLRRNTLGQLEALQPLQWGLDQVLGIGWGTSDKYDFGRFLQRALALDPEARPSAAELLETC
eukprot:CAMPEP_0172815616 /NCGR_PEP_ID=MMETSP1075-20121228/11854_1 /TAXON_ID=2916 /ORGANISM="Ceratium fusus, Strain PA161109" /LENGTH=679 /DNA_ID=CAMNT_0013655469 /DNA_START=59 /DNA_END=2096 /DNA_ORIENTATION=-